LRPAAFFVILGFLAGCGQSPADTYVNMSTAARLGDREAFLTGFTEDSRKIVKGLASLSEAYGFHESDPYRKFVFAKVVKDETLGEGEKTGKYTCPDSCAVLTVQGEGKSKGKKVKILMLKKEDGWRIDLAAQQEFWNVNK
jgi:hypothetical protein